MRISPHILAAVLLGGCTMMPALKLPSVDVPPDWKNAEAQQGPVFTMEKEWWKVYGSEELNQLIAQGLAHNNDLQAAIARIEQARASVRIAGSSLWPQVSATGSADRNDTNKSSASADYRIGANASYEVDLFGRNRSNLAGAQASLAATSFDREALAIIVATDIAQAYFDILTLRDQLRIARANLGIQKDVLGIVEARFNEGLISALEVSQQRSQYESSSAQLTEQERQLDIRENSLAILLAIAPSQLVVEGVDLAGIEPSYPTAPIPSKLLEARPDVKSAEASLVAANADIGAARAAFFPTLDLGASLAQSFDPSVLAGGLSTSLLAPIFRGGALSGGLALSEARQLEVIENYRKTVLTAFQEVENALAFVRSANIRQLQLANAKAESQRAYELSHEQFIAGAIDFQTLLDTQRSLLQSSNADAQARLDMLSASLALIKATGAGWRPQ